MQYLLFGDHGFSICAFFNGSWYTSGMIFNDPNATAEQMAAMKAKLGLDQPVMIQYFNWLVQLLHGNMGASYRTGHAVWADISERIGPTLLLTMSSLVFSILIAIPLGIMSAYKPYTAWDYISSAFSFIGAASQTSLQDWYLYISFL